MARRIYSDEERRQCHCARQRSYYYAKKKDAPNFIGRQRSETPKIKITMKELEIWVKFRKQFGDPKKYDWQGEI